MNKKGQESGFKNLIFAFILMALFGMLVITAVIDVGNSYGKDTSAVAGGSLAVQKFNNSVSSIETNAKAMKVRFESGSIWSAVAGVVVEGIFGIGKDMIAMIISPFDILSDILQDNLGVPLYVVSVMLGLLILAIIFGIWRLIKIGD